MTGMSRPDTSGKLGLDAFHWSTKAIVMSAQKGLEARAEPEEEAVVVRKMAVGIKVAFKGRMRYLRASLARMTCSERMLVRSSAEY